MNFQIRIKLIIGYLLLMVLICLPVQSGGAGSAGLPQAPLTIHTTTGIVAFQVELAATPEDRQRGLMFREELQQNEGMLFVYREDRRIAMWMKNTVIPLDILFITRAGKIVKIEANTEPLSLRAIPSESPVRAVLELKGGTAEFFGIKPGDQVTHGIFTSTNDGEITGNARIIDGNTIQINETEIRLYNIDAPEDLQECSNADGSLYHCGQLSVYELSLLTVGQDVRCVIDRTDIDGHRLGTCFVADMNINREMVARGWAVVYRNKKYDEDYLHTERLAKKLGNGMWRGAFVMPWEWRQGIRG